MKGIPALRLLCLLAVLASLTLRAAAQGPQPPQPSPTPTPQVPDENSTMTLNLNNVSLDQLIQFLSEVTGKPVIRQKDIQQQVTVLSTKPVTRRQALDLIYDAMLMDGIYVIEQAEKVQIVKADAIKRLQLKSVGPQENMQDYEDSFNVAQKIYHLTSITPANLKTLLEKFVPEAVISIDGNSNTLMLTDQIVRLKNYDRIVKALDSGDPSGRQVEIFKLQHSDAIELGTLLGNILTQSATPPAGGGNPGGMNMGQMMPPGMMGRPSSSGGASRTKGQSSAIVAGEVTLVPDPRMNWLIATGPEKQLTRVRELVGQFDQIEELDVQTRLLEIHHADGVKLANTVMQLFEESQGRSAKETIRIVPTQDGSKLAIMSSLANFESISQVVQKLDVENAEMRETRTYQIKNLVVVDLVEQLTKLFNEDNDSNRRYYYFFNSGQSDSEIKPSFVASARNNTLVVMARPRDFSLIEKMIEELDVPMDPSSFEPRIYRIRHTDANELVKVLETLFADKSGQDSFDFWSWRPVAGKSDSLTQQFGKIRFVVDKVTNTIVVLASNPHNYEIIEGLIQKLDRMDDETTEVLIYELKYANPTIVANHINNLFSDGVVQRQPRQNQNQPNNNNGENNQDAGQDTSNQEVEEAIYPWQSGGRDQKKDEERPINTMIGNVRVVPDPRSNKIMVAAPRIYFNALQLMIEDLDQQEPQVNISTRMVEILRGNERRIGIRWTPDSSQIDPSELNNAIMGLANLGFLDTWGSGTPFTTDNTFGQATTEAGNTILSSNINLTLLIQLLLKNSNSRIIAEPSLVVNNNERGQLFVGSQYPFSVNGQRTPEGTQNFTIEREPVGITLTITPHINTKREIVLTVNLVNSNVREGQLINGNPITDETKLTTQLAVDTNQTMVLGGIILENQGKINYKVPILGQIPIVNLLFKKTDNTASLRELVIFITPQVLNERLDDDALLEKANQRLQSDLLEENCTHLFEDLRGDQDEQCQGQLAPATVDDEPSSPSLEP